jgi:mannosyltransferase OCH1-like enzyme
MIPVEKADLFRYLIVYRDGGVYLDIDCFCVKNLDGLIKDQEFVAGYEQGWLEGGLMRYTQWAFAAQKKHPILLEAAYRCKKNHLRCSDMWTLKKTGPTMWTKVISEFKSKRNLSLGTESWFGSRIFGVNSKDTVPAHERKNIIRGINKQIADSREIYVVHLFYGSWHKGKKTNMQTVSDLRAIEHMTK